MNADEYRKLAAVEDRMWYFRALHGHVERALAANLGDRSARILDAGCGTGGLIIRMAPRHPAWSWTGIDAEPLACEYATARTRAAPATGTEQCATTVPEIRLGSVTELPFADESFDAVVSADVLYHVDDDARALDEFRRVLRPGGVVVLNVPAYRWLWSYHDEAVHSRRRYDRSEVVGKLQAAGFGVAGATYWNALPFPLVVLRRKLLPPPRGGSDVQLYPAPIETAFDIAMAMERGWLTVFDRLPFGSSVFAVGRKRQNLAGGE